jgi:serine/threonine-protein kinase RsbW
LQQGLHLICLRLTVLIRQDGDQTTIQLPRANGIPAGHVAPGVRQAAGAAPEDVVLRTQTAVEELLTNSVVHGHAEAHPGSEVWMSVTDHGGALYLCYEDALAPFDPAGQAPRGTCNARANPLDQRPLGGLGLLMVYRLADEFRYARDGERNCMDLAFQVRPVLS